MQNSNNSNSRGGGGEGVGVGVGGVHRSGGGAVPGEDSPYR